MEEREAGRGWLMSTWHDLVLPAHKDWNKRTVTTKYVVHVLCGNLSFKMIIIAILLMLLQYFLISDIDREDLILLGREFHSLMEEGKRVPEFNGGREK